MLLYYIKYMKNTIDIKELEQSINDWVFLNIGEKFEFREHQFETIVNICRNILEGVNHTQIIEAPTGSGKSLLNIISAGVLADMYGKSSYILCSDLFLWKQYEDFINQHPAIKRNFGIIKGQTGNYTCSRNGEDMRNSECRMAGVSWGKLFNPKSAKELDFGCASSCQYVKARKKALNSKVVIMTYQLYHFMINVVQNWMMDEHAAIFKKRDTIFCDECHNIPSIVKNNFTPTIKLSDFKHLKALHSYRGKIQLDLFEDEEDNTPDIGECELVNRKISLADLEEKYENIFNTLNDLHISIQAEETAINDYHKLLGMFSGTVEAIESTLSHKKQVLHQPYTNDDLALYKACSFYRNCMCFWNDFYTCISEIGMDYVIREIEESRTLKENIVKFSVVKEDYISWRFLLSTADNQVMMSATIGGYDAFAENVGVKYLEQEFEDPEEEIQFTQIPSTFEFDKSPVYFLNRYKMSYKEKENSLKSLKPIIYKICQTQFYGQRGMIQTGSYANAKEIYDNAPSDVQHRMLLYNNAKEKQQMITIHQMSKETILIGPTLVEGIDLPGDQCRFIIILKVPYPVIVDEYVKRKMELFPMWYNSTTSNIIIQGIGRGNRFKEDYCTTYILDACFLSLYNATKSQYAKELQERIKIYA